MRPTFHPQLVNPPFGDPGLYVDLLFEKRALLFDLGDIRALPPGKLLRASHVFVSPTPMVHRSPFQTQSLPPRGRQTVGESPLGRSAGRDRSSPARCVELSDGQGGVCSG
ncbi:hypothetical protein ACCAA_560017 [Candidatus Accumulibacter aalborgensis]|uniref:Uncharacterized protein n=1 Tax=Candidatus Accumulibacter aalborgensis TaxID=1860102 RepID=A0A1A8XTC4_9PROT|nr:hypothetical protein ACCAA_560017 [Candidatus Accumulibacter aalborgensis]